MTKKKKTKKSSGDFTRIANRIVKSRVLSPLARTVYCILRSFDNGRIFPGHEYLMAAGKMSKGSVHKSINELRKYGVISWEHYYYEGKRHNIYTIHPRSTWNLPKFKKKIRYTPYTDLGTSHELGLVHDVVGNKTNKTRLNERTSSKIRSELTIRAEKEEIGDLPKEQKPVGIKFLADMESVLSGKKYFKELPTLIADFTTKHGPLVPLHQVEHKLQLRFRDQKGNDILKSLLPLVTTAYSAALLRHEANNAPVETPEQKKKRIDEARKQQINRGIATGAIKQIINAESVQNKKHEQLFYFVDLPDHKGFTHDELMELIGTVGGTLSENFDY